VVALNEGRCVGAFGSGGRSGLGESLCGVRLIDGLNFRDEPSREKPADPQWFIPFQSTINEINVDFE